MPDALDALVRSRAGATLLDSRVVGWAWRIDRETLYVGHARSCLVFQLFGGFVAGLRELGIPPGENGHEFGFGWNKEDTPQTMHQLTSAWLAEIEARRMDDGDDLAVPAYAAMNTPDLVP